MNSAHHYAVGLRRFGLNLVEIRSSERIVIHYWTDLADPRLLFKEQRLARPEVQVGHWRHKNGSVVLQPGHNFLYGERPLHDFRWGQIQQEWQHRDQEEADDWTAAAVRTYSREGLPERWIPWAILKSIWRREEAPLCPNCDVPLVVIAFRLNRHLLSENDSYLDRVCFSCRRLFQDWCDDSPWAWLVKHLAPAMLPAWHHGIVTTDLRPSHTEEQVQKASGRRMRWTRVDRPGWKNP